MQYIQQVLRPDKFRYYFSNVENDGTLGWRGITMFSFRLALLITQFALWTSFVDDQNIHKLIIPGPSFEDRLQYGVNAESFHLVPNCLTFNQSLELVSICKNGDLKIPLDHGCKTIGINSGWWHTLTIIGLVLQSLSWFMAGLCFYVGLGPNSLTPYRMKGVKWCYYASVVFVAWSGITHYGYYAHDPNELCLALRRDEQRLDRNVCNIQLSAVRPPPKINFTGMDIHRDFVWASTVLSSCKGTSILMGSDDILRVDLQPTQTTINQLRNAQFDYAGRWFWELAMVFLILTCTTWPRRISIIIYKHQLPPSNSCCSASIFVHETGISQTIAEDIVDYMGRTCVCIGRPLMSNEVVQPFRRIAESESDSDSNSDSDSGSESDKATRRKRHRRRNTKRHKRHQNDHVTVDITTDEYKHQDDDSPINGVQQALLASFASNETVSNSD